MTLETIIEALSRWNSTASDRQKLQHTYAVLLVIIVFTAGAITLFNGSPSPLLMYISLALITTLLINFLAWSLLQTSLLNKIPKKRTTKR